MQQLTVQNHLDFSKIQQLSPQQNSFNKSDSYSSSSKTFADFVNEAKVNSEKASYSENQLNPDEKTAKKDKSLKDAEQAAETAKKTPDENSALADEKESVSEESVKIAGKDAENKLEKQVLKEELKNGTEKTAKIEKNAEVSPEIPVEISKKTPEKDGSKIQSKEKEQKNAGKSKNQIENNDLNLVEAVLVSGNSAVNQLENKEIGTDNPRLSDFMESEETGSLEGLDSKSEKKFFLDKDKKIAVQDLRSENSVQKTDEKSGKSMKSSTEISGIYRNEKNNPQVTMDFAANAQQNIGSLNNQVAGSAGSNFQAMLANQIQENAGEIVKAGNIVLKDNDVGSIKLILHPESLGNVKIDLQVNEKNISGKIIVATQEAFNAFKETAENLKQAFVQSGFESAGLELSLANQNFAGNHSGENQNNPAAEFAMRKVYGEINGFAEENFPEIENIENSAMNSINIVA